MANKFKKNVTPKEITLTTVDNTDAMTYTVPHLHVDYSGFFKNTKENNKKTKEEKWIWVEGYKGTNADMTCRDHKFELGVQYDIPEDEEIVECERGYHLCLNLKDVFRYYNIGIGRKFFKVKALVRQRDVDRYGKYTTDYLLGGSLRDKLAARSIILESEVPKEELYSEIRKNDYDFKDVDDKYIDIALTTSRGEALSMHRTDTLIADGYSKIFAQAIADSCTYYERAHILASLEGLSMDVKVMQIFRED